MADLTKLVNTYLPKFKEVGLTISRTESEVLESLKGFPQDMLNDFDEEGSLDFMLMCIQSPDAFDMDFEGLGYECFLEMIQKISKDEVVFEDAKMHVDPEVEESGQGKCDITFKCNGKKYSYNAIYNYDWFDHNFIHFVNTVMEDQKIDKRIIAFGNANICEFTFQKPEWVEKFKSLIPMEADVM